MPAANSSVTTLRLAGTRLPRRRRTRSRPSASATRSAYRPYHPHGEAIVLMLSAMAGVLWLVWPIGFWFHFVGSFFFFVVFPTTLLRSYWPRLRLETLGWQLPIHPRQPVLYSLIATLLCFLPLMAFLVVKNPGALAAVDPTSPWLAWLISEALVGFLLLTSAAFFAGLIFFRLTHLIHPWAAIIIVAILLSITQVLLPGTIGLYGLPVSLALVWMAWQTKSFVPVAILQFLLSLTFDLIVKIS